MRPAAALPALMLAMLPVPAAGQIAPGYSGTSSAYYVGQDEYWMLVRDFGTCFAKVDPAASWALLVTRPGSREEGAAYKAIRKGKSHLCFTQTSLSAAIPFVRGSIAEALLKRGERVPAELQLAGTDEVGAPQTLGDAALCLVRSRRSEAERLLSTQPGSKKELAQLQAMGPDWFACLPDRAQKFAFNPTQIRYRLAEVLLRTPSALAVQTKVEE